MSKKGDKTMYKFVWFVVLAVAIFSSTVFADKRSRHSFALDSVERSLVPQCNSATLVKVEAALISINIDEDDVDIAVMLDISPLKAIPMLDPTQYDGGVILARADQEKVIQLPLDAVSLDNCMDGRNRTCLSGTIPTKHVMSFVDKLKRLKKGLRFMSFFVVPNESISEPPLKIPLAKTKPAVGDIIAVYYEGEVGYKKILRRREKGLELTKIDSKKSDGMIYTDDLLGAIPLALMEGGSFSLAGLIIDSELFSLLGVLQKNSKEWKKANTKYFK